MSFQKGIEGREIDDGTISGAQLRLIVVDRGSGTLAVLS